MATQEATQEASTPAASEERRALDTLIAASLPHPSIVAAEIKDAGEATIQIKVRPKLAPDDGNRIVEPRSIPLLLGLTLFGGPLYVGRVTSKKRQEQGQRLLHYVYIFSRPHHLPVERIFADAGAGQKVQLRGDHHDLRRSNLDLGPDSRRTRTAAREEAIEEAIRHHGKAAADFLPPSFYRAMLEFGMTFFDTASPALITPAAAD